MKTTASVGWLSLDGCTPSPTAVVADGFFAGLEETLISVNIVQSMTIHAPGFDATHLNATWYPNGSTNGTIHPLIKLSPGVWEVLEFPEHRGLHTLNLRFTWDGGQEGVYAVKVDLGPDPEPDL
jgi:hypothetical protein